MSRVFFLSSHICVGESGGGHGVVFRLYTADQKYRLFGEQAVYVFKDRIIEGNQNNSSYPEQKDIKKQSELRVRIKKYIPSALRIAKLRKTFSDLKLYLAEMDKKYHFNSDDVFVLHDYRFAYAFLQQYSFPRVAFVYHGQGSLYYEWQAETGIHSELMRYFFNSVFVTICKQIKVLCFPSKGTEESLLESEPVLVPAVTATERKYLYNGVSCPDVKAGDLPEWIKEIERFEGLKFVTVANLNEAKAVERIPQYLKRLKDAGIAFRWVLVGNGVKAPEVESEIKKYQLSDSVIWKKQNVQHSDLMKLFSVTDFYILFHKYSIFDLSTLEAMHYGNIPILTPVGGNKEMIIDGNGLFVSDFTDGKPLLDLLDAGGLEEQKQKNTAIQNKLFNDEAFLRRYVALCDMLGGISNSSLEA